MPYRFAYLGLPQVGGPFAAYRQLRAGLAAQGVDARWLGIAAPTAAQATRDAWPAELAFGQVLSAQATDESDQARAVADFLIRDGYDGVFVNVLADRIYTNLARFLDARVRRVMVVHSLTPGTYRAVRTARDFVDAAIAVSPRIQRDLVDAQGFDPRTTFAVFNAVDSTPTSEPWQPPHRTPELRILSLGRLEHASKGVLWLPQICSQLSIPYTLTIAGDGPDMAAVQRQCASLKVPAHFAGQVPFEETAALFRRHDVFLMPSQYEGSPVALVEAMAAGCVPVATHIRGVTNEIIRDGVDGRLFPRRDFAAAARCLESLAANHVELDRMANSCRERARDNFSVAEMARQYAQVIEQVLHSPHRIKPLPWSEWRYPRGLGGGMQSAIPRSVKNVVYAIRRRYWA